MNYLFQTHKRDSRTTSGQKKRKICGLEVTCRGTHKLNGELDYLFQAKQTDLINTIAEFSTSNADTQLLPLRHDFTARIKNGRFNVYI